MVVSRKILLDNVLFGSPFISAYLVGVTTKRSSDDNETTVSVSGRFDCDIFDAFTESYTSIPEKCTCIDINLSATDYINSSALGMLLMLREHINGVAIISLVNPTPDVKRVLSIANFDKLFAIRLDAD